MAEKYGTIPKRFTKAWWEYFWEYYKIHTIVILFIIFAVGITIYQVKTAPKYDLNITYTGEYMFSDESAGKLKESLSTNIDDLDNNGEKSIFLQQICFKDDDQDAQMTAAMITKLQLEFVTDDTMLFIFDKTKVPQLFNSNMDGAFIPVDEWLDSPVDEDKIYFNHDTGYAVKLNDSKIFKNSDIPSENLYIAVRNSHSEEQEIIDKIQQSKKLANIIVKS